MNHCTLAKGFSLKEKLFTQMSFWGIFITGIAGIFLSDPIFVIPYVLICGYGFPGIIQRHIVCPRCPHLYEYGDCLQLPPKLTLMLIKKQKPPKFRRWEKIVFLFILICLPVYPLYFLFKTPLLLILFILFSALYYGGMFLHFCKACRVSDCPFNRTKQKVLIHKKILEKQ
ncbi:MAG: hypothetical protein GY729_03645 [Desulfobacteraceae bacterium]|nr:hypothetical protein [Desulfobacteraceae bacterium]